jgi:hypothetical protein
MVAAKCNSFVLFSVLGAAVCCTITCMLYQLVQQLPARAAGISNSVSSACWYVMDLQHMYTPPAVTHTL